MDGGLGSEGGDEGSREDSVRDEGKCEGGDRRGGGVYDRKVVEGIQ